MLQHVRDQVHGPQQQAGMPPALELLGNRMTAAAVSGSGADPRLARSGLRAATREVAATTRPMRVLMLGPALTATGGIAAVVNHWLGAGLDAQVRLEHLSTLDNNGPGHHLEKVCNASRACWKLARTSPKPDLVHVHVSQDMSFYRKLVLFAIAKLRGIVTVVHLHGSSFSDFYRDGSGTTRYLIRTFFDRADAIIVLSASWHAFVSGVSKNGRVCIVPNGAPVQPAMAEAQASGTDAGELRITFMGQLGRRKGVYDLLEAFRRMAPSVPNARLVLGGDGEVEQVKALAAQLGIADRVDVLGWVSGQDRLDTYRRSDIYVLPSYKEGLPGSVLEAMSFGKPIISTPVGGIPEAVIEGRNGFLVEPGNIDALADRMQRLCLDREARTRMGRASRHLIETNFDIRVLVDRLVAVYESVSPRRS
jgi:glycosyltransferase involved in cell wall biosynthesis